MLPPVLFRPARPRIAACYISLADFVKWTGVQPSSVEVAASGSPEEVARVLDQLGQEMPAADVRPVRQIMEGEARVLGKTRATLFAAAALIILTAALCVLSTLMGWVFDRRRDFAIMKALGASGRLLNGFFAMRGCGSGRDRSRTGICRGYWHCSLDWTGQFPCCRSTTFQ